MMNELTNDEIEELVGLNDVEQNFLKTRKNGLLLTDNQVNILSRHNIDASKCTTISELLYMIDEAGLDDDDEELSDIAEKIAEINYYNNTRK